MFQKIKIAYEIVRCQGAGFCAFRLWYAIKRKTGILKYRFQQGRWEKAKHQTNRVVDYGKFFAGKEKIALPEQQLQELKKQAQNILDNKLRWFFNQWYDFKGDWFINPLTGAKADSTSHWSRISHFDKNTGDIKFIWEPSRFAWAYILSRAFVATGDERYAEKFWELFTSWLNTNQPNTGVNYICGQECAIRLMAVVFAFFSLQNSKTLSEDRKNKILTFCYVHADRIERNISYAVSTRTNHSLTEAAGIYTVGVLFPFFDKSELWKNKGKRILVREGLKQICPDGSYIQQSMNYHRLMLQDFIWVLRLADLNGDDFEPVLCERIKKSVDFLYQLQDVSGRVPNYGANDGALIIPLNSCDYLDYRPVIQAGHFIFTRQKIYDSGFWDEELIWLFGAEAVKAEICKNGKHNFAANDRGYYSLRNDESWLMTRCHSFRERPGHADLLSADLWWHGKNILRDAGSYMYNYQEPWESFFPSTQAHNTVTINDKSQMEKYSRFLWLGWANSKLLKHEHRDNLGLFEGEHYGYVKSTGSTHRRSILCMPGTWIIIDDIFGQNESVRVCCNWHLADGQLNVTQAQAKLKFDDNNYAITFLANTIFSIEPGLPYKNDLSWESLYYGSKQPKPSLSVIAESKSSIRIVTLFSDLPILNQVLKNSEHLAFERNGESFKLMLKELGNNTGTFVELTCKNKTFKLI